MSEVLASLKKIGGSEQYTETVLWTNPDTSVDFGAQVVTLSDSLSNYKYLKVNYRYNKGSGTESLSVFIPVEDFYKTNARPGHKASISVQDATYWYTRYYWYLTPTTIQVYPCYKSGSSLAPTAANNVVIPNYISGVNELAHQTVVGKYAVTDIQKITANTVPTFATRGKALAIWFTFGSRSSAVMQMFTNVNPSTGEINNNEVYYAYYSGTSQLSQWAVTTTTFVVTDNSISTSVSISSSERWGYIGYTYE